MPGPSTWQELTKRNIQTVVEIFKGAGLDADEKLRVYEIAWKIIRDDRFDSVSARWNALHNTMRIVVESLQSTEPRKYDASLNYQNAADDAN